MPQKSKMWCYFKKVNDSTVSCNLCNKHIKSSGNTSNMMKHLNIHNKSADKPKELKLLARRKKKSADYTFHKNHWLELDNVDNTEVSLPGRSYEAKVEEKSLSVQMNVPSTVASFERLSSFSDDRDCYAQISDAILYFICVDNRPFNTIQCKGFKHLMEELAPLYKVPGKDVIKKRLDEKYDTVTRIFKQKLRETSHVTITTDIWTEPVTSKSYLAITVHFIANENRKLRLESGNIEVIELVDHTENYIACALLNALTKWSIDISKVVAVVTNNETNVVNAVTQTFGQDRHVVCFAHVINLIAENSMKNCEGFIDIINKIRSVVKFVKSNVYVNDELHRHQIGTGTSKNETKKLILDVEVRWITTFYMIERFIELWNEMNEIFFTKHEIPEPLTAEELVTLKEILDLLKPLEFMAQECSAESYIAISKVIPLISCTLTEYKNSTQTTGLSARLKETILMELERRLGHMEFVNLASLATILDPRFKTIHFRNAQALANATYLLRDTISILSNVSTSSESDAEQKETKYDLWAHHRFLAHKSKKEDHDESSKDELSLYLANPLICLKNNPLEKWDAMRMLYPSLYKLAIKYLSIVATSVPANNLFSKEGITTIRSRNQQTGKRLHKLLFLNSVNEEYWFQ